jgi:hypothetical protein
VVEVRVWRRAHVVVVRTWWRCARGGGAHVVAVRTWWRAHGGARVVAVRVPVVHGGSAQG